MIDVEGDAAWMETYSLITHRPDVADPTADWVAAGEYVDRLVREDGRWRIAERGPSARRDRPPSQAQFHSDDPQLQRLLDRAAIHDAIVSSAINLDREDGRTRHFLNNELVELDGDVATAETYMFVTEQQADGKPSPWSNGPRRWVDEFERIDGRWVLDDREEVGNRVANEFVISAAEAAARTGNREGRRG